MTRWHFRRRNSDSDSTVRHTIDASAIRRSALEGKSIDAIRTIPLTADGRDAPLDELFECQLDESEPDEIIVEGDLHNVHGIGAEHDRGDFRVIGSVGDYAGCGMTGGKLLIQGDAGNFVAAPSGTHKIGMAGGQIQVDGSAGDYVGHRMRRGMLIIQGSAGDKLAASMVAGTVCVGGEIGDDLAVGMKRGTVILANDLGLVRQADALGGVHNRFSRPIRFDPGFLTLYSDRVFRDLTRPLRRLPVFRTRADRTVGGLGEVVFAVSAPTALG